MATKTGRGWPATGTALYRLTARRANGARCVAPFSTPATPSMPIPPSEACIRRADAWRVTRRGAISLSPSRRSMSSASRLSSQDIHEMGFTTSA